jgi:hypothetical protein
MFRHTTYHREVERDRNYIDGQARWLYSVVSDPERMTREDPSYCTICFINEVRNVDEFFHEMSRICGGRGNFTLKRVRDKNFKLRLFVRYEFRISPEYLARIYVRDNEDSVAASSEDEEDGEDLNDEEDDDDNITSWNLRVIRMPYEPSGSSPLPLIDDIVEDNEIEFPSDDDCPSLQPSGRPKILRGVDASPTYFIKSLQSLHGRISALESRY